MRYPSILICVGLVLAASITRAADSRPNVLFIVADDLNHWIGSLQRNPQTKTPNLDRLASLGVNFTHAYCASPLCDPSRSALLSGKRTATIGIYSNMDLPWSDYIDEQHCLTAYFRAHGYYTAGAGKIYHTGGGGTFKNLQGTDWDEYVVRFGKDLGLGDDERRAGKPKKHSSPLKDEVAEVLSQINWYSCRVFSRPARCERSRGAKPSAAQGHEGG